MSRGQNRCLIPQAFSDMEKWPAPDLAAIPAQSLLLYNLRREAVEMYAAGESYEAILQATRKSAAEVRRLVTRCVAPDGVGGIFGYHALIKGTRVQQYTRTAPIRRMPGEGSAGCAGALQQLFSQVPDAADLVDTLLFKRASNHMVHEARIPYRAIHAEFKKFLRGKGLTNSDWPFNTSNCGYNALVNYCNSLKEKHLSRWVRVRSGADASRRSSLGRGFKPLIPVLRPFIHVQFDFHKVDAASIIVLENKHGKELEIPLPRWYFGLLSEEYSHAVIGVYLALEINPSGDSVLETVDSAIRPISARDDEEKSWLTEGLLLPNQLFKQLAYHGFSALKMDNAWSNTATTVVNALIDTVGCAVNFGPTRAWWRRPLVERIFKELTSHGLQRLPSTFGTGPADTRNEGANEKAVQFRIMLSQLTKIIFNCIREYNETPSEGLHFSSPIEVLKSAFEKRSSGYVPQWLSIESQRDCRLLHYVIECRIRGDIKKHIRPYIQIDRCIYTNDVLANSYLLIGKTLVVYIDRRDVRVAYGVLKDTGENLGPLSTERRWASSPISVRDRKLINRSGLSLWATREQDDPIREWSESKKRELISQRKTKSARKKPSKDALTIARMSFRPAEVDMSDMARPAPSEVQAPRPDPFGLSNVPSVPSTARGR